MLSQHLKQCFANIGARLRVKTNPRSDSVTLVVKRDRRGPYLQLKLPRLSRPIVSLQMIDQRRARLVLELNHRDRQAFVAVQMRPRPRIRTLSPAEMESLSATLPKAA